MSNFKFLLIMFAPYKTVQMQISTLSAFLKMCGCEVKYLEIIIFSSDTFGSYEDKIKEEIDKFQPDMVGFSSYDMNYSFIIECAKLIKSYSKNTKTIVGGHHASLAPEDYMQYESFDYVCIGEGEYVLKDLMNALTKGESVEQIKGLVSRKANGEIINPGARDLIEDLDELPFIDREILHDYQLDLPYLPIFAGKGCPFNCTYCANESMKKLYPNKNCYVRLRSPMKVIEEIKQCKKVYKFKFIYFYDDLFATNYKWLKEFCELYNKHFPGLPYHCLLRPELATKEKILKLLSESNCEMILMGLESGSEKYRQKVLKRRMTNDTILKATSLVKTYKMKLYVFMMTGLPDESLLDMIKSLWLNFRVGPDSVQTAIYFPLKNTALYKLCVERNLINEERKKELFVYTYNTCLDYGFFKRRMIVLFKWLNSATPVIRHLELSLILHFFRIQYNKRFKKVTDYT